LATPTKKGFDLLLARLDPLADKAAEKYKELRLRLVKYFILSCHCPESRADELADKTLDRMATKLEQNTIIENIRAYALTTARYIWLENSHGLREESWEDEPHDVPNESHEIEEPDERYLCLKMCLEKVITEESDRTLILEYYNAAEGEKNKDHRKKLAQSRGLEVGTLKVRACRLRKNLEKCVRDCMKNRAAM